MLLLLSIKYLINAFKTFHIERKQNKPQHERKNKYIILCRHNLKKISRNCKISNWFSSRYKRIFVVREIKVPRVQSFKKKYYYRDSTWRVTCVGNISKGWGGENREDTHTTHHQHSEGNLCSLKQRSISFLYNISFRTENLCSAFMWNSIIILSFFLFKNNILPCV